MCLLINNDVANAIQWDESGYIDGWKVLRKDSDGNLTSFYIVDFKWKIGINESNRKNKELGYSELRDREVNSGIHVWLDYYTAEDVLVHYNRLYNCFKLVKVRCHRDDFVTAGRDRSLGGKAAVFMKVELCA